MTQRSYFHDGTSRGHAANAPYSQETFAGLLSAFYDADGAWVLPNQLNNLAVTTSAGMTISISTGRAIIYGYWFENDSAATLTISDNTSSFARWDMVVAQLDTDTGQATFVALQGASGSLMHLPPLNTCATIKQLPLALIYVGAGAVSVAATDIYDQRLFLNNVYHRNRYTTQNDFPNGLFIGWADSQNSGSSRQPMPGWKATGATRPPTKDATRFDHMPYGRCVKFYGSPSDDGMQFTINTYANSTDMVTFSMWLKILRGTLVVSFAGTSRTFYPCQDVYHVIFHLSVTGNQVLSLTADGTDVDIVFGDLRMALGYCEAEQKSNQPAEVILFDAPVRAYVDGVEKSWAGLTTGDAIAANYTRFGHPEDVYPLGASINIPDPAKGYVKKLYVMQVRANDSGSATTALCQFGIYDLHFDGSYGGFLIANVGGAGNDVYRYATGFVYGEASRRLVAADQAIYSSGAATLDGLVEIIGVVI